MKPLASSLLLTLLLASCLQAQHQRVLVNTSHAGQVLDVAYDADRNLIFSAGEDGTVRVWEAASKKLVHLLRVSRRPVQRIALHPQAKQLAVLEGEKLRSQSISVWDWEQERMLFSLDFGEQVLSLTYSAQGSYLLASRERFDSLYLLEPGSGRRLPLPIAGFGIVSFAVFSRNERNLMTYQPSGSIAYWDLETGRNLRQVRTVSNLSAIRITPNNRFMLAAGNDNLLAVDLLSGEVTAQADLPGIVCLVVSDQGNEVFALAESGGGSQLSSWYFSGKLLLSAPFPASAEQRHLVCLAYGNGEILAADKRGSLYSFQATGESELIAQNVLLQVTGLAFSGNSAAVGSAGNVLYFPADFFAKTQAGESPEGVSAQRQFPNPFQAAVGVEFLDARRLLLWRRDEQPGAMALLDLESGAVESLPFQFESSLLQASPGAFPGTSPGAGQVLTVEKSGQCKLLDLKSLEIRFQYLSPGMNKLIATQGDFLIGGRSSTPSFGSPLLQIDRGSGETVMIPDSSLYVYDLAWDERAGRLFCLEVEGSQNDSFTLLKMRFGRDLSGQQILYRSRGEDLSACLALDPAGGLYTSLGADTVRLWNGGSLLEFEKSPHSPRRIFIAGEKLFSLNRDSSLTVWDLASRGILMDVYLFKDSAWAALTPAGEVFVSSSGRSYLSFPD